MVYRKGELSKGTIDREWPHQVALPAVCCLGHNYVTIRLFCEGLARIAWAVLARGETYRAPALAVPV